MNKNNYIITIIIISFGFFAISVYAQKKGIIQVEKDNYQLNARKIELEKKLEKLQKQTAIEIDEAIKKEKEQRKQLLEEIAKREQNLADLESAKDIIVETNKGKSKLKEILAEIEKANKRTSELKKASADLQKETYDDSGDKLRKKQLQDRLSVLRPSNKAPSTFSDAKEEALSIIEKQKKAAALYEELNKDVSEAEDVLTDLVARTRRGQPPVRTASNSQSNQPLKTYFNQIVKDYNAKYKENVVVSKIEISQPKTRGSSRYVTVTISFEDGRTVEVQIDEKLNPNEQKNNVTLKNLLTGHIRKKLQPEELSK